MEKVKLGDVFSFIRNGANIKQGLDDSGYPITRIETISDRTVNREKMGYAGITDISKYDDYILQNGDILMSHINSEKHLGKTAIYKKQKDEKIIHGMNLLCLRPDNSQILPEYAFYFLSSNDFLRQIPNITKKSVNQASFTVTALKELSFAKCGIDEQKEVVCELDKVTDLIDKRKEQLLKLDELVKARFVELFGDPVENPYGWEQTTLKNIAIGKLSYGSGASACEYDEKIRYVRITDIDSSGRLNDDLVSPSVIDEKYILNDGDILFARSGATVGKSYRYRESDGKCLYAGYLIRLVPNTELVLPDYVFYYTKTSYYERFVESNMKVVAQPNINAQQYGDLTICIPPMELQKDFLTFVKQTDKSKLAVQKSLDKLELLKKALMQKYFG